MDSNRKTAIIVGALILIAYCVLGSLFLESKIIAMLLELISGAASIGVAVLIFPILKPVNKNLTLGYTAVKIIEGVVYIVAGILLFSQIIKPETHVWINEYHVYIFGTAFLMLSYLLYQSKLVPRFISVWGIIGSTVLLLATLINMIALGPAIPFFFSHLPVISNEIFLAVWLIAKGFNPSAIASLSVKTDINKV
jgi:uncharacterized protein YhhL (DUF1145 family)